MVSRIHDSEERGRTLERVCAELYYSCCSFPEYFYFQLQDNDGYNSKNQKEENKWRKILGLVPRDIEMKHDQYTTTIVCSPGGASVRPRSLPAHLHFVSKEKENKINHTFRKTISSQYKQVKKELAEVPLDLLCTVVLLSWLGWVVGVFGFFFVIVVVRGLVVVGGKAWSLNRCKKPTPFNAAKR